MPYGLYNMQELQRQVISLGNQNPYRAINSYGKLKAQAMATQLGRQLQFQQMAQADRMNALQHSINMAGLQNRMGQLKLDKRELKNDKSPLPWTIGLGLSTTGLNAWQQYSQRKSRKAQTAQQLKETRDYQNKLLAALKRRSK